MWIYVIGDKGGDEGIRERYETALGDMVYLTRDLRDRSRVMERINIR